MTSEIANVIHLVNIARRKVLILAQWNPFADVVEAIRFAMCGQFNIVSWAVVLLGTGVFLGSPGGSTTLSAGGSSSAGSLVAPRVRHNSLGEPDDWTD